MGWTARPRPIRGGWRVRFGGHDYWRTTEGAAWVLLDELRRQAGTPEDERAPTTISGLVERWGREHDQRHADEMLDEFDAWAGGRKLADVPAGILDEYRRHLARRKSQNPGYPGRLSMETTRKKVIAAGSVLRWAVAQGWIARAPDMPRLPKSAPRPKAPTPAELQAFLASLAAGARTKKHALPLIRFILETGCRPGEARLLEWAEVDTERACAVIPAHKTLSRMAEPQPRVFPLSTTALDIVAGQRRFGGRYVFPSYRGAHYERQGIGSICLRHGLAIYKLRHAWCQAACDAGVPESVVSEIMGHSSSAMIRMYRRITDQRMHAAVLQLDGLSMPPPLPQPPRLKPGHAKARRHTASGRRPARRAKTASGDGHRRNAGGSAAAAPAAPSRARKRA